MTDRDRKGRGWVVADIEERERVALSSYPPDPEDGVETLLGIGAHRNGNGSSPEMIPPPDFGEEELPDAAASTVHEQQLSTALLLMGERQRLVEQQLVDQRFKALERKLDDKALETKDNFAGLRDQLKQRDEIAASIRENDRVVDAAAHSSMMSEIRARTPGRLGIAFALLLLAATAAGAIVGAHALSDMAHDMRQQQGQH